MQACINRFHVCPLPFPLFLDVFMELSWYWCYLASVTGNPTQQEQYTEQIKIK